MEMIKYGYIYPGKNKYLIKMEDVSSIKSKMGELTVSIVELTISTERAHHPPDPHFLRQYTYYLDYIRSSAKLWPHELL